MAKGEQPTEPVRFSPPGPPPYEAYYPQPREFDSAFYSHSVSPASLISQSPLTDSMMYASPSPVPLQWSPQLVQYYYGGVPVGQPVVREPDLQPLSATMPQIPSMFAESANTKKHG